MHLKICIDVDGPCADMFSVWFDKYNQLFDDNVTPQQMTRWDFQGVVRPEALAGYPNDPMSKILLDPDFYDLVKPVPGFAEGIKKIREAGHTIRYVSSCPPGTHDMKMRWLEQHAPDFDWRDTWFGYHKADIQGDVLIDDGPHNLDGAKMKTVRWRAPYNQNTAAHAHTSTWDTILWTLSAAMNRDSKYVEAYGI